MHPDLTFITFVPFVVNIVIFVTMKTISFTTAQYVKIDYELAPAAYRVVASFIDFIAMMIYLLIMNMFLNDHNVFEVTNTELVFSVLLIRLPWLLYSPIIEYFTNGRSLGKYIMGIRVVKANGETAGLREYFTRWVFRVVDIWIGGFGFLAILLAGTTEKRQRLGDIMANTVVIRTKDTQIYSLRDVLNIKSQENHEPTYPAVTRFSDEDMLLIKNTIIRVQRYPNDANKNFAIQLANETASLIGLPETPAKRMEFLKTVLQDYVVLTR
jgi:uncharacterized RDD family membrane protein YckC